MENNFSDSSKGYIKTTENINGYYSLLDFTDKDVLTVVGSSDQIFEAILRGSKNVDGFDISINSIMLYFLKEAALKTLNYQEFMEFFYEERHFFDKDTYSRIRANLNPNAVGFWDNVFSQDDVMSFVFENIAHKVPLYMSYKVAEMKLSCLSSYLEERNYNYLKSIINEANIRVYNKDVYQLDDLQNNYDYIILSNIFEYQNDEEFKAAIERYRYKLKENGMLIVGYAYHDVDK